MNHTCVIYDENGNVVIQGLVSGYTLKAHYDRAVQFEVNGYVAALDEQDTVCKHEWTDYEGLFESGQYCKQCGNPRND